MANTFLTPTWLTMESLRILVNKLQVAQFFNTDYNKEFTREFPVGETVQVKLPQRFLVREGLGYNPQAINRINTTVTVDQIFGVDFEWDSAEAALKVERGEERVKREYIEPAMAQLAQEIDSRAALFAYQNANNIVGVLGTDPTTLDSISGAARQRLIEKACPPSNDKGMIVPPSVERAMVAAGVGYFNPSSDISRQYKEGSMGRQGGFDWYSSMSLYRHTAGTWAGAVTVNGASQSGASLNINCTSGDTFKKGDVFSIASVYAVNPSTRRATTTLQQFVVTADVTASGTTATLAISPAIYGPGSQYQNVDALPGNTAALTLFPGTTSPSGKVGTNGLALHRNAFAMVGVKLEVPKAVELASQTRDPDTGISVRFIRQFDPIQSKMVNRFDVLLGFGNLYPDNCAVRILSA
ncbi:MAG TPA: P22 phage major capsid protein family protein [Gemmatimonadaceae bacterium]|nr:P22 phage major capsid protein family protein [Gemmatimonadaceae bacterium]